MSPNPAHAHYELVRDLKKFTADAEYLVATTEDPKTASAFEAILKKLAQKAQSRRELLIEQTKGLKKE